MFKWFKHQQDIMRRVGGLAEKQRAITRKIQVASSIIERRSESDRRREERRMTMNKGSECLPAY